MRRTLVLISILILKLNYVSGQDFIGYKDGNGVFFDSEENTFVDFNYNKIKGIDYRDGLKPLFINDNSIIYLDENSIQLNIFSDSKVKIINLDKKPYYTTANDLTNIIVLSDEDFILKIIWVNIGNTHKSIDGFAPVFIDNQLYFSNYSDVKSPTDISVDIFKADIDSAMNISNVFKITSGIAGDGWYITPDSKYIIGTKIFSGNLKDVIFTISSKNFTVLYTELLSSGYRPFYSIKDKTLYFYNSKDRIKINLPM